MKLKVVVVDLELTRRQRRIGVAGFLLAGALAASVALADVPKTFVAGETLRAADLNENFENLDGRVVALEDAGVTVTQWEAYTPIVSAGSTVLAATAEAGVEMAYWRRVGDTLEVVMAVKPNCGVASGQIHWSLPAGLAVDHTKTPLASYYGSGFMYKSNTFSVQPVFVEDADDGGVSIDTPPNAGGVYCTNAFDPGTSVRMRFSLPIEGW